MGEGANFGASPVLSHVSLPKSETSLHLELVCENFVIHHPHLFANKKVAVAVGGCLSTSPNRQCSSLPSAACFLSLSLYLPEN